MGDAAERARQRRRIERRAKALTPRISAWLKRRAKLELDEALRGLRSGKWKLKKDAAGDLDYQLAQILTDFGVRQLDDAGKELAMGWGGTWSVPPNMVERIIRTKAIKVTRLSRNIKSRVLEEIRAITSAANREAPRPSVGEISRRLRERFSAGAKDQIWALDPARAALIARTEAQQNESTGMFQAARDIGVEAKRWLASGNPNHGDRRHDLMDGQERLINEPFRNPTTGKKLMHSGDPNADISETANCGCAFASIRKSDMKKRLRLV